MAYTITWSDKGIIWEYSGVMTGEDLINSNLEIFGDERFDDLRYQIADLTRVEAIDINEIHIRKMAYLDLAAARSNPNIRVAVVSSSEATAQIGESYANYSKEKSPWKTKIFSSLEEAQEWVLE